MWLSPKEDQEKGLNNIIKITCYSRVKLELLALELYCNVVYVCVTHRPIEWSRVTQQSKRLNEFKEYKYKGKVECAFYYSSIEINIGLECKHKRL